MLIQKQSLLATVTVIMSHHLHGSVSIYTSECNIQAYTQMYTSFHWDRLPVQSPVVFTRIHIHMYIYIHTCYICKGKTVPLQAWSGPEGSRKLRFPDFMKTAQDGGKVVSLTHRPPLPPGNTHGTHFCQRVSRLLGHSVTGRIMSLKNSDDTIANRTRNLPVCSIVP